MYIVQAEAAPRDEARGRPGLLREAATNLIVL